MKKQPKTDEIDRPLTLIDTADLIDELTQRHNEIIIIRENRKDSGLLDIRAKTNFGKRGNPDIGFDIVFALQLLHSTEEQLLRDHLDFKEDDNDGNDAQQDADCSS